MFTGMLRQVHTTIKLWGRNAIFNISSRPCTLSSAGAQSRYPSNVNLALLDIPSPAFLTIPSTDLHCPQHPPFLLPLNLCIHSFILSALFSRSFQHSKMSLPQRVFCDLSILSYGVLYHKPLIFP